MRERALIYARTAARGKTQLQVQKCRAFCEEHGLEVVRVREDHGAAVPQELADAEITESPDFDVIVAEDFRRIDRRMSHAFWRLLWKAGDRGIRVLTVDGKDLTTDEWRLRTLQWSNPDRDERERELAELRELRREGKRRIVLELTEDDYAALERKLLADPEMVGPLAQLYVGEQDPEAS